MFERIELGRDSHLDIAEQWLSPEEADALLQGLRTELPWEQRANVVYGKTIPHARLMAWAGEIPTPLAVKPCPLVRFILACKPFTIASARQ